MQYLTKISKLIVLSTILLLSIQSFANNGEVLMKKYLGEFLCDHNGEDIILEWYTTPNTKIIEFDIERSTGDLNTFHTIGKIESSGMNEDILYLHIDENPSLQNKYRLKMKLKTGQIVYSEIIQIQSQEALELGAK